MPNLSWRKRVRKSELIKEEMKKFLILDYECLYGGKKNLKPEGFPRK